MSNAMHLALDWSAAPKIGGWVHSGDGYRSLSRTHSYFPVGPMPRLSGWVDRVNAPLSNRELEAVRNCVQRGRRLGDEGWVESIARRLNLDSTYAPEVAREFDSQK